MLQIKNIFRIIQKRSTWKNDRGFCCILWHDKISFTFLLLSIMKIRIISVDWFVSGLYRPLFGFLFIVTSIPFS